MAVRRVLLAIALAACATPASADDAGRAALVAALHGKVAACWMVPTDLPAHIEAVRVKFFLTETGALDGSPIIEGRIGGDGATKAFAASAVRAIVRCAPFTGLARLAPYADWKTVAMTFKRP